MEMSFLLEPNQLEAQLPTHPPHMTTGVKLLKFTLHQETSNLQINLQVQSSIFICRSCSRPPNPCCYTKLLYKWPPISRLGEITMIHITNSTGYTDLKWQEEKPPNKNAGTIVCYCTSLLSHGLMETLKKKCSKAHNLSEFGIFCVQIPGLFDYSRGGDVKFKLAMHMFKKHADLLPATLLLDLLDIWRFSIS